MRRPTPKQVILIAAALCLLLLLYVFGATVLLQSILWVLVGAVVGWIGSLVMATDTQQGILLDILTGALGAFAGLLLFGAPISGGGPLERFLASAVGSVIVVAAMALVRGWRPGRGWRRAAESAR
jgi:uncharacterized membrane protein YeaQ/YmgE (transglycosylase-associated protein family)